MSEIHGQLKFLLKGASSIYDNCQGYDGRVARAKYSGEREIWIFINPRRIFSERLESYLHQRAP